MTWQPEVEELERRRQLALQMGGEERVENQHERGKLTIRERIDALVDAGSFRERGLLAVQTHMKHNRQFRPYT